MSSVQFSGIGLASIWRASTVKEGFGGYRSGSPSPSRRNFCRQTKYAVHDGNRCDRVLESRYILGSLTVVLYLCAVAP